MASSNAPQFCMCFQTLRPAVISEHAPFLLCFIIVCAAIISIVHPRSVSLPLDGKLHTPTCHLMASPKSFCCWVFIIVCAAMISISPSECQVPLSGSTSIVIPTPIRLCFFQLGWRCNQIMARFSVIVLSNMFTNLLVQPDSKVLGIRVSACPWQVFWTTKRSGCTFIKA